MPSFHRIIAFALAGLLIWTVPAMAQSNACAPKTGMISGLRFDVLGSDTILNDWDDKTGTAGQVLSNAPVNVLTLRIENIANYLGGKSKDHSFKFTNSDFADGTTLAISLDLQPGSEDAPIEKPWALGHATLLKNAKVSIADTSSFRLKNVNVVTVGGSVDRPNMVAGDTRFLLSFGSDFEIVPGERLDLKIELPVTAAPTGQSNLHLVFQNLQVNPVHGKCDYRTVARTHTNVALHKQPLVMRGRDVGIGTADPKARLHVAGGAVFDEKVGIGTTTPTSSLDVNGIAKVNGSLFVRGSPASVHLGEGFSNTWTLGMSGEQFSISRNIALDSIWTAMRLSADGNMTLKRREHGAPGILLQDVRSDKQSVPALEIRSKWPSIRFADEKGQSGWEMKVIPDAIQFWPVVNGQISGDGAFGFSFHRGKMRLFLDEDRAVETVASEVAMELMAEVLDGRNFEKLINEKIHDFVTKNCGFKRDGSIAC
ncbi:hypothetical protein [Shimia ponticola]|uniref:hypothetical protein n=1 Tax=Shimia ponticola TaxID=2582893 RepID=UPI0011BDCDD3|nr:hypothetical protein [Shimia ponticola]